MKNLNLALWVLSVLLQCILLAVLVWRDRVRRVPIFAILIGFYVLRSSALYVVVELHRGASYPLLFSGLALVDVVLQTAVAWELFSAIWRPANAQPAPNAVRSKSAEPSSNLTAPGLSKVPLLTLAAAFSVLLIASAASAAAISMLIHANPRAPMDRSVLFTATLFLLVFLASLARRPAPLIRRLVDGFGLYAAATIACQIGRAIAGAERNQTLFNRWTYTESAAYLAAVLIWIIALSQAPSTDQPPT